MQTNYIDNGDEQGAYILTDKEKEVVPKIEQLLSGFSYKETEELFFGLLQKIKSTSLVAL